jgi:IclR family pca regulon transcriptional regulator
MGRVLVAALSDEDLEIYLANVLTENHTPKTISDSLGLRTEILRVREQGYALVDQELEVGLRSLAVPVITRSGKVVAAMNTGVHASRVTTAEMLSRFLPVLKEGALSLGQALT